MSLRVPQELRRVIGMIILDPPAFAKKKADVVRACRGYKDINRLALQKTASGGFLLTLSCSHFVDAGLFQQVVCEAAVEAGRRVRILQRHHLACDHPVNLFHPESEYLKGLLLLRGMNTRRGDDDKEAMMATQLQWRQVFRTTVFVHAAIVAAVLLYAVMLEVLKATLRPMPFVRRSR